MARLSCSFLDLTSLRDSTALCPSVCPGSEFSTRKKSNHHSQLTAANRAALTDDVSWVSCVFDSRYVF